MECTLVAPFSHVSPIARWLWEQDHFPALAGIDQLESLGEVFHGKGMGDHRLDIESGLEEAGQAVPGFEESAACNAVDANPLKNNFICEIAIDRAGRNAEECDASAVLHGTEGLMQCRRVPRHFERGVDAFACRDLANGGGDPVRRLGLGVEQMIGADLFGQVQAVRTDIRGNDHGGAGRSCDGGRKESCRTAAGDQDCLSREVFD